jgi:hypothetical protein
MKTFIHHCFNLKNKTQNSKDFFITSSVAKRKHKIKNIDSSLLQPQTKTTKLETSCQKIETGERSKTHKIVRGRAEGERLLEEPLRGFSML